MANAVVKAELAEGSAPTPPTLAAFLEEAPGREQEVSATVEYLQRMQRWELKLPSIRLHCESDACEDVVFFDPDNSDIALDSSVEGKAMTRLAFALYTCRHCMRTQKIFALRVRTTGGHVETLRVMKFGETPPAVGPTPRALKDLLGDQWDLFLQGRRSEIAGLGIGAFTYYRRAVEGVWQTMLKRLAEVARMDGSEPRLAALTAAQSEKHFTRSMEAAAGAVPPSLYVDGHNPLQALYDACGDGLHEYTDEDCIARSRMIRLVLARFSERAKAVLSEDREFRQAVGGLAGKSGAPTGAASVASPGATKAPNH